MVNTFLPYPSFVQSAKALDYRRLGKQRVEAWQILNALLGESKGWTNHPATKMWRGHEKALCKYGVAICQEWIKRGYKDTLLPKFVAVHATLPDTGMPKWLGEISIHQSHQSNLKRKDSDHYGFNVPDDLPYQWVDPETESRYTVINGVRTYLEENKTESGINA
jgi:hypothetical protein